MTRRPDKDIRKVVRSVIGQATGWGPIDLKLQNLKREQAANRAGTRRQAKEEVPASAGDDGGLDEDDQGASTSVATSSPGRAENDQE